jgi:hypothetical protein
MCQDGRKIVIYLRSIYDDIKSRITFISCMLCQINAGKIFAAAYSQNSLSAQAKFEAMKRKTLIY